MTEKRTLNIDEWLSEGEKLFGKDKKNWRFVCPSCSHMQTPGDFLALKIKDLSPETAWFSCIGRWIQDCENEFIGKKKGQPCNYAGGGLFRMNPVIVIDDKGKEHQVFEFDK